MAQGTQTEDTDLTEKIREQVEAQLKQARAATARAQEQLETAAGQTREDGLHFVRGNPGLALAGAMGVGVLVGLALRGRG